MYHVICAVLKQSDREFEHHTLRAGRVGALVQYNVAVRVCVS